MQAAKEAGLPEEQAKEIAATTAATAVAEGAAIASVREISCWAASKRLSQTYYVLKRCWLRSWPLANGGTVPTHAKLR